jgi:hypothetical protein
MMPIARRTPRSQPRTSSYILPIALLAVLVLFGQMIWLNQHDYMFRPFSIEKLRCEVCGGTGVVRSEPDDTVLAICPVCFGVGGHHIRRIDKEDKLCSACTGMGRVQGEDGARTCRRCDGRGMVRDQPWTSRAKETEE